jgi:tRNA dimethylallyltransferase
VADNARGAGGAGLPELRACVTIVGPTAVGKTGLIVDLAARYPVEVISLDSRQIYRGLRIGTAQPSAAETARCRHHLVDFLDPVNSYSAEQYRRDFEHVVKDCVARGVRPVLVGGAGMYLTALREGLLELPAGADARLAEIRAELAPLSDAEIRRRLEAADLPSHRRIHPNDRYRGQRALEIHALTGRPMSALLAAQHPRPSLGLAFPTFRLTRPVAELNDRIARRTAAMLADGWIAETEALLRRYPADCPGLASIGYRDIAAHLRGEFARAELPARIETATRQYAKRQRTWFRHAPQIMSGRPDDPKLRAALGAAIEAAAP